MLDKVGSLVESEVLSGIIVGNISVEEAGVDTDVIGFVEVTNPLVDREDDCSDVKPDNWVEEMADDVPTTLDEEDFVEINVEMDVECVEVACECDVEAIDGRFMRIDEEVFVECEDVKDK